MQWMDGERVERDGDSKRESQEEKGQLQEKRDEDK